MKKISSFFKVMNLLSNVKTKWVFFFNFVAFSEYLNYILFLMGTFVKLQESDKMGVYEMGVLLTKTFIFLRVRG